MPRKLIPPQISTFGGTRTPFAEALHVLGSRVTKDRQHGYILDGKFATVFDIIKAAKPLLEE